MALYNDNPTLTDIKKEMLGEDKQGDVFFKEQLQDNNEKHLKKFYIESYGCAMNFSDSEIVASVLGDAGFGPTKEMEEADLILINTCSIREKAEDTVRKRLKIFNKVKKSKSGTLVGVLGCMAERLKSKLLEQEKLVDLVVGPDAYRTLPQLVSTAESGEKGVNVLLSREETYAEISPVRLGSNGVSAFVTIMRGCDNMCSFCIVPFTRGRERSRDPFSIVAECRDLFNKGYREVTLLGQNVDSYKWENPDTGEVVSFARLLQLTADVDPLMRVRFSTSHPKDITDEVLKTIVGNENVCNYIHLPVQSGNSRILELMNRTYDREWYEERVKAIYKYIPDCAISADVITGFCSETEEEHQDTLSIIEFAKYSMSYMFYYSERPGTLAARKLTDDIPLEIKKRRLAEVIKVQSRISLEHNKQDIGKTFKILIEKVSKRSEEELCGRNSQNKMVIFPRKDAKIGTYVWVKITDCSSATLRGEITSSPVE